jgi:hypothetical protein
MALGQGPQHLIRIGLQPLSWPESGLKAYRPATGCEVQGFGNQSTRFMTEAVVRVALIKVFLGDTVISKYKVLCTSLHKPMRQYRLS